MRKGYILTEEAQADRDDFTSEYGHKGNCSCFTGCAPCSSCTHPGNPLNQEEDDSCWVKELQPMKLEEVKEGQRVRLLPGSFDAGVVDLPAGSEGVVVCKGSLVGVGWDNFAGGWTWKTADKNGWAVEAEYLELLEDVK